MVYLKLVYGERAIAQILTKSYLQGKSAIDKVVMILGDRDTEDRKRRFKNGEEMRPGEIKFQKVKRENGVEETEADVVPADYRNISDRLKKKPGVDFTKSLAENREALMAGCDSDIEKEIIDTAIIMDGNLDHTGLHAAGCIISDNNDLAEYIPVAWDTKFETWKTQCDMVQCESMYGLLKMDLLLLKTLDIITYALRLIQKNRPNVKIDIENLPIEEKVIKAIYAKGNTKDVFQFESGGMVKYLKQLEPTRIEDIIAMNAMYRPGPLDSIPTYIENKKSGKITYDCPQLEPILKETYGIIVYQEQVMQIVRDLAGYSIGRSDLVRRAMAKKHLDELVAERKNFVYGNEKEGIHGCVALGISEDVANGIFDKMLSFASYAFNKAHAAAYSVTSYMTAWLKYYYPVEFYAAVLNYSEKLDVLPAIISDAKKHNIQVLKPDINKSSAEFSTENGAVRFGLSFLRGAKASAQTLIDAREGGFEKFSDFVKAEPGKALAEACILSGACDCLCGNRPEKRKAMLATYNELADLWKKLQNTKRQLDEVDDPESKRATDLTEKLQQLVQTWEEKENVLVSETAMEIKDYLDCEVKYTSVYFSGHPLDHYFIPDNCISIDSVNIGENVWIAATISEEEERKTKTGSRPMLIGKLSDYTDSIPFIVFPKVFERYAEALKTKTMGFYGVVTQDDEGQLQFTVNEVRPLAQKVNKKILVNFTSKEYNSVRNLLRDGASEDGLPVYMRANTGKLYYVCKVTEEYVAQHNLNYVMQ